MTVNLVLFYDLVMGHWLIFAIYPDNEGPKRSNERVQRLWQVYIHKQYSLLYWSLQVKLKEHVNCEFDPLINGGNDDNPIYLTTSSSPHNYVVSSEPYYKITSKSLHKGHAKTGKTGKNIKTQRAKYHGKQLKGINIIIFLFMFSIVTFSFVTILCLTQFH